MHETLLLNQKKIDLLKSVNRKSKIEEKPKMETCIFCIEEFNINEIVNPKLECNKHIHGKCFATYIEEELNNNRFPIKCPICQKEDRHEINYKILLDCLLLNDKDNLSKKLEAVSLNYLAVTNPESVTFCPTPGCNYIVYYDRNEYHLNCPLCMKSYCLKCKTEWHKDLTCEEYQYQIRKKDEEVINDQKFGDYLRGNNCKQCPRCKRWVEKIDGCDHITCPCGTHFCYNCGEIRDSIRPYEHVCPPRFFNNNMGYMNNNMNNMNYNFGYMNYNMNNIDYMNNNMNNFNNFNYNRNNMGNMYNFNNLNYNRNMNYNRNNMDNMGNLNNFNNLNYNRNNLDNINENRNNIGNMNNNYNRNNINNRNNLDDRNYNDNINNNRNNLDNRNYNINNDFDNMDNYDDNDYYY